MEKTCQSCFDALKENHILSVCVAFLLTPQAIQKGGNGKAKDKYEANLPSNFRRPQDD